MGVKKSVNAPKSVNAMNPPLNDCKNSYCSHLTQILAFSHFQCLSLWKSLSPDGSCVHVFFCFSEYATAQQRFPRIRRPFDKVPACPPHAGSLVTGEYNLVEGMDCGSEGEGDTGSEGEGETGDLGGVCGMRISEGVRGALLRKMMEGVCGLRACESLDSSASVICFCNSQRSSSSAACS